MQKLLFEEIRFELSKVFSSNSGKYRCEVLAHLIEKDDLCNMTLEFNMPYDPSVRLPEGNDQMKAEALECLSEALNALKAKTA